MEMLDSCWRRIRQSGLLSSLDPSADCRTEAAVGEGGDPQAGLAASSERVHPAGGCCS